MKKEINNWEDFLDSYFILFKAEIKKNFYKQGLTIECKSESIYIWCDLDSALTKIKKIEFGKVGDEEPSWVKGVFINKKPFIEFLQTSFSGEDGEEYESDFNEENKQRILKCLQIPFETGWDEKEYRLGKKGYYKVGVKVLSENEKLIWNIPLYSMVEQDIPGPENLFKPLSVFIQDSFITGYWRHVDKVVIKPMQKISGENKKNR